MRSSKCFYCNETKKAVSWVIRSFQFGVQALLKWENTQGTFCFKHKKSIGCCFREICFTYLKELWYIVFCTNSLNKHYSANIYLFKVSIRNTRVKSEICSKITIKTINFAVFPRNSSFSLIKILLLMDKKWNHKWRKLLGTNNRGTLFESFQVKVKVK